MAGMPVVPPIPTQLPKTGNTLSKAIGKVMLRLIGWRVYGEFPSENKMILAVGPHTSRQDAVIGLYVRLALGLDIHWLGHPLLFKSPFGKLFSYLGGIPIEQGLPESSVRDLITQIDSKENFLLAISPEGTRGKVDRFNTSFLRIACECRIPVLLTGLDYYTKEVILSQLFYPSGNHSNDEKKIRKFMFRFTPKHPQRYCDWEEPLGQ